ncbi:hypothetical protein, partial [Bacillus cereus group sp. Bc237]|uniref:hypothetical protein n=1 Tax=Bacillus cereus group sp. Bc237 TaxID=3018108 RepID=UPI003F22F5FD
MRDLLLSLAFCALIATSINTGAQAAEPASAMQTIGNARAFSQVSDGLVIDCDDKSQVKLQVLAPDLVRVRVA